MPSIRFTAPYVGGEDMCDRPVCPHRWLAVYDPGNDARFPWVVLAPHSGAMLHPDSDAGSIDGGSFASWEEANAAARAGFAAARLPEADHWRTTVPRNLTAAVD